MLARNMTWTMIDEMVEVQIKKPDPYTGVDPIEIKIHEL